MKVRWLYGSKLYNTDIIHGCESPLAGRLGPGGGPTQPALLQVPPAPRGVTSAARFGP